MFKTCGWGVTHTAYLPCCVVPSFRLKATQHVEDSVADAEATVAGVEAIAAGVEATVAGVEAFAVGAVVGVAVLEMGYHVLKRPVGFAPSTATSTMSCTPAFLLGPVTLMRHWTLPLWWTRSQFSMMARTAQSLSTALSTAQSCTPRS